MAILNARNRRSYAPQQKKLHSDHHGSNDVPNLQRYRLANTEERSSQCLLLQGLCDTGQVQVASDALSRIHCPLPTSIYLSLLKASVRSNSLLLVLYTRIHLTANRVSVKGFLADYLVMTLAKCGAVDEARNLSASLPHLTVFSWTAIIFAYANSDRGEEALEAYQDMLKDGISPDSFTFVSLFKACGSIPNIDQGKALHLHAQNMGLATHKFVGNSIVSMYGKCGVISDAEDVFVAMTDRDAVSWNGMLSAYVEQGQGKKSLLLYRQMHEEGMVADLATFVIVFQACATLAEDEDAPRSLKAAIYQIGRALHSDARKKSFDSHFLVGTAILSMYAHCGTFVEAESIFSMLLNRDLIAWNAMLTVYVEQEQAEKALSLYLHMQQEGISPDLLTYLFAVQACGILGEKADNSVHAGMTISRCLEIGQAFHLELRSKGYSAHIPVANALLSMYGKCGALAEAEEAFHEINECDIISWNAMLAAYCEHGQKEKALSLFKVMHTQQVSVTDVTLICILQICGETGYLELGRSVHFDIVYAGLDKLPALTATLVNAYGSCASLADAEVVFDSYAEPNIVAWNVCIAGYAGDKTSVGSLYVFENMRLTGFTPDDVTYTSLLSACSHNGLVIECLDYLSNASGRATNGIKHLNTIIDLFGRAGDFKRLMWYFRKFKMESDPVSWSNLLGACSAHGNVELAKHAFDQAVRMEATESSVFVLMSNIYADAGLGK
ncbi:hypothetical protein GOP47_0011865 [Adiantum capillus-veneris]|uniref:Pentatricopeptide repeat-containing protein n=1 Tax=Adiantum capillus-veneris TaxID=13818 RepID=A0A9D4ZH67_ADICA|nr:hypothetical protein GOP47_0011865 [Adiantum capillus-veneris]